MYCNIKEKGEREPPSIIVGFNPPESLYVDSPRGMLHVSGRRGRSFADQLHEKDDLISSGSILPPVLSRYRSISHICLMLESSVKAH